MGVASALSEMDMTQVETFLNDATVEGTLQQEKLASMLQQVTMGVDRINEAAGDASLEDLMAELDGEVEASQTTEDEELGEVMNQLDAAAAKGAEAARKLRIQDQRGAKERTGKAAEQPDRES
jgi:hypothetical protein